MKPITKAGLALVAIVGIAQALLTAALLWPLRPVVAVYVASGQVSRWIMLGLTAVACLTFIVILLVALLRHSTTNQLVMPGAQGNLSMSRQAVENTVAKAIATDHPVKSVDVSVTMNQRKQSAKVNVEAYSLRNSDLIAEGKRIEETVKRKITDILGVPVAQVKVKLHTADQAPSNVSRVL